MFAVEWGHRLKEQRRAAGLTQQELGVAAGLDQRSVSRMEIGLLRGPE